MTLNVLSAADFVVACLALFVGLYQVWVFSRQPRRHEHLWAACISFGAAAFAAAVGISFVEQPAQSRETRAVTYISIVFLVHVMPAFCGALAGKRIPYWSRFAPLSIITWVAMVTLSPWLITTQLESVYIEALGRNYVHLGGTWLTALFFFYCIAVACFGLWWLYHHSQGRRAEHLLIFAGFAAWIVAGGYDSLNILGWLSTSNTSTLEYGFLIFALALFARSAREHADLIDVQQAQLATSEHSFTQLVERSPDLIAMHREGRFIYANPVSATALGYGSTDDLIGKPIAEIVHSDDRTMVRERMLDVARSGKPLPPQNERLLRKDGSVLELEVVALPSVFDGEPCTVVIARDLSERNRLQAKLMQIDRMAAMGTLAAGVAHEINNPLTYIAGNLSLLQNDIQQLASWHQKDQARREHLDPSSLLADVASKVADMVDGTDRIATVVRDLGSVTRQPALEKGPVDLKQVIRAATRIAGNEIRHRAQLNLDLSEDITVEGNASKLGQVFINLLVNAAQAIPTGQVSRNWIRVRSSCVSGQIHIEVEDSGKGIAPDRLRAIFDPFVTDKPRGRGTGLGLAISQQIVHDHGGEIRVESRPGEGSTFTVALPEATAPKPENNTAQSSSDPDSEAIAQRGQASDQHSPRVLVVDDEAIIGNMLTRLLAPHYRCTVVQSVAAAVVQMEQDASFHAVLCDLMMPERTGIDFYQLLLKRWPQLAAHTIMMSGGVFDQSILDFLDDHSIALIDKPIDIQQLHRLLRKYVSVRRSNGFT